MSDNNHNDSEIIQDISLSLQNLILNSEFEPIGPHNDWTDQFGDAIVAENELLGSRAEFVFKYPATVENKLLLSKYSSIPRIGDLAATYEISIDSVESSSDEEETPEDFLGLVAGTILVYESRIFANFVDGSVQSFDPEVNDWYAELANYFGLTSDELFYGGDDSAPFYGEYNTEQLGRFRDGIRLLPSLLQKVELE